jgi:hypothetical protein
MKQNRLFYILFDVYGTQRQQPPLEWKPSHIRITSGLSGVQHGRTLTFIVPFAFGLDEALLRAQQVSNPPDWKRGPFPAVLILKGHGIANQMGCQKKGARFLAKHNIGYLDT